MRLLKATLSKEDLLTIPDDERMFLIQACYLLNELNILAKLVQYASNWSDHPVERKGEIVQTFHLSLTLAAKLQEGKLLVDQLYSSGLSRRLHSRLRARGSEAYREINMYFGGSDNIISFLRNNFASHRPKDDLVNEQVERWRPAERFEMFLAEGQGNSLYAFSYDLVFRAVVEFVGETLGVTEDHGGSMNETVAKDCIDKLVGDMLRVYGWFQTFLNEAVACVLESNLEIGAPEEIKLTALSAMGEIKLPFFVERE